MGVKLQKETQAVEEFKQRLASLNFDPSAASALEANAQESRAQMQALQDRVDELNSQLNAVNFEFRDPERNFDRSKVKGVVAKLVRVHDPKVSTALEVAAGGKLFQVVVDTEQTAKALFTNGQLRSRVTIIPLNKVAYKPIPSEVVAAAKAYNDARTRQAIADADLSELKRDQAASKLVSADDVRQAWKIAARALRDGILALPDRVAELVAATDSAEECRQLLDTEIRKILNKLSDAPPDPRTGS